MNSKTITWGLGVIVIMFLTVFFVSQNFIFDRGNRIENIMVEITKAIKDENWIQADKSFNDLNEIWEKGKYLVALNNAEQNFLDMDNSMQMLEGAIETKDNKGAVQITKRIQGQWKSFRKIIPEP